MRTYVLGDKPIEFEFLSDQNQNFPDSFIHSVNYEDQNLNVGIPIFSIHGNHDDVNGQGRLSSMNILSSVGYINYFGKWQDLKEVEINPIVLQKKETKLAMYGLSHIHDARLARLFRDHKVKVCKPDISDEEIFNLMVLHQNRADRGRYNYLPEDKLPGFLDLIVWGHEHDCRIEPEPNGRTKAFITQPGSSVATSLSEGEAIEKHVGILLVEGKEFRMQPVKLRTVRPFIFRTINVDDFAEEMQLNVGDVRTKTEKLYCQNIEEMIEESKAKLSGHSKQPTLPLIRLRVLYSNENHIINTARFGQKFETRIANPESSLKFKKNIKRTKNVAYDPDEAALQMAYEKKEQKNRVEDVVESYFNSIENEKDQLQLFNLKSLTEVCRLFVDKEDEAAATTILDMHYEKALAFMKDKMCHEEDISAALEEFRTKKSKEAFDQAVVENSRNKVSRKQSTAMSDDDDENDPPEEKSVKAPAARGRGPRRGRGALGAAASTRGRGKKGAEANDPNLSFALNVKKGRGASSVLQSPLAQSTQRSQRSVLGNKSKSIYVSDSDSD